MKKLITLKIIIFISIVYPTVIYAANLDRHLRNHTFSYVDMHTGLEHTLYIGRFGNNYDEYFPCKFVDGTWNITKDGRICFTDRISKTRRISKECLKPVIKEKKIFFFDYSGELVIRTKLTEGNHLPLG